MLGIHRLNDFMILKTYFMHPNHDPILTIYFSRKCSPKVVFLVELGLEHCVCRILGLGCMYVSNAAAKFSIASKPEENSTKPSNRNSIKSLKLRVINAPHCYNKGS